MITHESVLNALCKEPSEEIQTLIINYVKEQEKKEERAKKVEEFISLCSVETTDTGHEVVFWRDENYEYAKQLLKVLKEELK